MAALRLAWTVTSAPAVEFLASTRPSRQVVRKQPLGAANLALHCEHVTPRGLMSPSSPSLRRRYPLRGHFARTRRLGYRLMPFHSTAMRAGAPVSAVGVGTTSLRCLRQRRGYDRALCSRPPPPPGVTAARIAHHAYQMSFDGSFENETDERLEAAGCGTYVWGPVDEHGKRNCIAQAKVAGSYGTAQLAEGGALKLGLWLIFILGLDLQEVEIVGDCDAVIGFATLHGGPRSAHLWDVLGDVLPHVSAHNWRLRYTVVPRTSNVLANSLAQEGVLLARNKDSQPHLWTTVDTLGVLPWFPRPSRCALPLAPLCLPSPR